MTDPNDEIAVFEDPNHNIHFIPCDESQVEMRHVLDKTCQCGPVEEVLDNCGKKETVLVHNKILH
jgi:hypothetical protein